jgi:hypothetical protein
MLFSTIWKVIAKKKWNILMNGMNVQWKWSGKSFEMIIWSIKKSKKCNNRKILHQLFRTQKEIEMQKVKKKIVYTPSSKKL